MANAEFTALLLTELLVNSSHNRIVFSIFSVCAYKLFFFIISRINKHIFAPALTVSDIFAFKMFDIEK